MIDLIFPDGSKRQFDDGVTGKDVAASIAPSLAKRAALIKLDGALYDVDRPLPHGGHFEILARDAPGALETLRHDASHVMAEAVQELFPGTQVTIGPSIEDGFYYDFARDEPFSLDDLAKIEQRMKEIVDRDEPITREVWKRDEAVKHFQSIGEKYKAEIIEGIPAGEDVSVYRQGQWKDLCRGPHFPSTKFVGKAFKLTKLAGAYWRGDHRNPMLQRIYGTAWASEADLEAHLHRLEEGEVLALKAMTCPGHVQIFNHGQKSYRDLPLRMAEFGACHRYEPSGALHGIFRVRGFTQDDAHIFCREDQIEAESTKFVKLL